MVKIIYTTIIMLSSLLSQISSLPIYSNHNKQIHLDPAIVVTKPTHEPILYEPLELAIVPPSAPPAPPGPIILNDIMPAKFVLPDGSIIYTPKDSKPFIISPFSDLEPIVQPKSSY